MGWHNYKTASGKMDWYKDEVKAFTVAHLQPNSKRTEVIPGQPWDDDTKKATEEVMKEMLRQYDWPTNAEEVQDITCLGNKVWTDPERPTRNYFGFSEEGLIAMRAVREAEGKTVADCSDATGLQHQVKRAVESTSHSTEAQELRNSSTERYGPLLSRDSQGPHRSRRDYSRVPPPPSYP